jgi:hypothetical protein
LSDGNGFPAGTNPVAVSVANLNGRPDLIVANAGSNDVSILLNEPEGNGFTFVQGPRLKVGAGPVALLHGDLARNARTSGSLRSWLRWLTTRNRLGNARARQIQASPTSAGSPGRRWACFFSNDPTHS